MAATSPIPWAFEEQPQESHLDLIEEHFPLLLARVVGHLEPRQLLQMIRFFDEVGERVQRERRSPVIIIDASEAAMPCQLIREMLMDWLSDQPRNCGAKTLVIAPNPMIRGLVASLKWATGRGDSLETVTGVGQAIARAASYLRAKGEPVPALLLEAEDEEDDDD
ncbi:hypothetical protein G6O69_20625 [Pseudenhygromyxa sp. WMMC2535]|uniref:hypothetical protein n=1 Tax=Pseudenhygromyxa sp. WMMC2535 TaxID=2712867 RepID=UPI0015953DD5|nr:hypothetical protein [Pseudenhygromyxa sp. WMMC2535]NVB40260.1 hypothetical protein [Pseudenhygromyxa sp. WMMC2535]